MIRKKSAFTDTPVFGLLHCKIHLESFRERRAKVYAVLAVSVQVGTDVWELEVLAVDLVTVAERALVSAPAPAYHILSTLRHCCIYSVREFQSQLRLLRWGHVQEFCGLGRPKPEQEAKY